MARWSRERQQHWISSLHSSLTTCRGHVCEVHTGVNITCVSCDMYLCVTCLYILCACVCVSMCLHVCVYVLWHVHVPVSAIGTVSHRTFSGHFFNFPLYLTKFILAAMYLHMYVGNAFESMSEHFQWLTMSTVCVCVCTCVCDMYVHVFVHVCVTCMCMCLYMCV